jgi:hypothetical protein
MLCCVRQDTTSTCAVADEGSTPLGAKGYFVAPCVASVDQPLPRKTTIYWRSLLVYKATATVNRPLKNYLPCIGCLENVFQRPVK